MKKIHKLSTIAFTFIFTGTSLLAQNIELPDVTTVIEGDTIKAGLDTLPSFSDVLVVEGNSGKVVPKLPEVEAPEASPAPSAATGTEEKTIFAEGLIGGGYPGLFTGNFSVFRMTGESPFKLEFNYDSSNGYANHSLTDCFYDRNAKLFVEKNYKKDKLYWGVNGLYQTSNDGLQNQIEGISSLNQEIYDINGNISYELGKGFSAGGDLDINFYNRFADVTKGDFPTVTYLNMNPDVFIKWNGYGAEIKFDVAYLMGRDTKNQISEDIQHRGEFMLSADWANNIVDIYGKASAVIGNNIGDNSVVVPFTVGGALGLPVSFSSRKFSLVAEGGIESKLPSLYETENKYKFTTSTFVIPEQSDWYGKIGIALPVGEGFTGNLDFEYKQTAFNNNLCIPDYETVSAYGCYSYDWKENQQANTKLVLSYHHKFITFTGTWQSYWLMVPALEAQNSVGVDINFQDEQARFGVDLFAKFAFGDEEIVPMINLEAFARITPAVRGVVAVNDLVELMKGEQRVYAGNYIGRSGNVSALLKFFF